MLKLCKVCGEYKEESEFSYKDIISEAQSYFINGYMAILLFALFYDVLLFFFLFYGGIAQLVEQYK